MSHHFDTTRARADARLNICDMYLFPGARADTTAMVLTSNPDAGVFAPSTPHPEAIYAFRFDVDDDAQEDVVFEVRPSGEGDRYQYQVLRVEAGHGGGGDVLLEGQVGEPACARGVQAFVGVAAELWAADAFGFFTLVNALHQNALHQQDRFATEAFENRNNLFKNRNVLATVLVEREREVTDALVDLLIATVHRVGARAERKVTEELIHAAQTQGDLRPDFGIDDLHLLFFTFPTDRSPAARTRWLTLLLTGLTAR